MKKFLQGIWQFLSYICVPQWCVRKKTKMLSKRGIHYLNDCIGVFDNNEDWILCPFDTTDREIAEENIMDRNYDSAKDKMHEILSVSLTNLYEHRIKEDFIGYRFYNIDKPEIFDAVISQIKKGKMAILPLNFNDVIDPLLISYLKESEKSKDKIVNTYYKLFRQVFDSVRIVCMCKAGNERLDLAINNHLMWAHYAASHRGICVKYRIQPSSLPSQKDNFAFLSDVQYKDAKVNKHNLTLPQALLLKSKAWSYENECRLICYNKPFSTGLYYVDVQVESIYLGANFNTGLIGMIKNELKSVDVPVFKMTIDKSNYMNLTAVSL